MKKIIIGLSGTFASGKDTLAEWLAQEKGFFHVSTSDILRQEYRNNIEASETDRKELFVFANELRQKNGGDFLVQLALKLADNSGQDKIIISGIRAVDEASCIKKRGGKIIFVDSDVTARYQRAKSRARDQEIKSLEDFIKSEGKENKSSVDSGHQNLSAVKNIANTVIYNNSTLEDCFFSASEYLSRLN